LPELIHNVLREHHRHHQPHAFDDIIEQCRRLAAIMNVKFDDVFHSPRDDLVWKSSMPVEDFEPLSQTIPCDAHAEILPSAVEASDLEQTSNRITATMQNAEAGNDSYVGGVPGNRITFAWAALWKHDVVMGFMLDNTVISLQTAFIQAIKMDHYVVIAALLHANDGGLRRRIDGPIWKEASALQWALHEGRFEIAELLIRAGANVNRRGLDHDHDKKSSEPVPFASTYPLQIAAALGTPEMVKLLMGRGAAIDVRSRLYDWDRMTAIEAAFVYGQGRSAWVLIDRETHRADAVDWNGILRAAIDRRQESGVKLILESAWRQYGQHLDRYSPKITMVQRAVDLGHPGMVTALLENHRCPNTNTGRRGSALQLALGLKDHDAARAIVEVLLLHGADTHAATKGDLEPPLHLAVRRSSEAMTKLLLHHGADVNAQSKARDKETALHAAVAANSSSLAEILVAGGADVEAICDSGAELRYHLGQGPTTPMRLAVGHVEPGMIRLLLQSGAKAEPSLLSLLSSSAGRYRDVNQAQIDEALRLLLEYGANAGKEISMEDFSREALGAPGTPKYYERYPRAIRET
jgi:ankyrin repeat protein